ncbi:MAG TPA: chromate transporter, partial [Terriglobales bacterium]
MSDVLVYPAIKEPAAVEVLSAGISVKDIFVEFLLIGSTSFGGGVVAYLRSGLVAKRQWINDKEFVELLAISQSLPGLNATNMAILVGDKLRGVAGSIAAIFAMCLPGAILMYGAGIAYQAHGDRPLATAALRGVAAAAVGLVLATAVQLGKKSLSQYYDLIFVAITIL